jgi:uncharacterized membrane protein YdjX (TVP38/TMEM64 family)
MVRNLIIIMKLPVKFSLKKSELIHISAIAVLIILMMVVGSFVDLSVLRDHVTRAGVWAPLVFIALKVSTIVFTPLSGSVLYVLVGTLFGAIEGVLYALVADIIGFSILFFLGRKFGLPIATRLLGKDDSRTVEFIKNRANTMHSFAKLCLVMFWFPELAIFTAGIGPLPYLRVMIIFMPIYVTATSILIVGSALLLV